MPRLRQSRTRALARNTDPETSHEAARGCKVGENEALVLAALRGAYPESLTTHDIIAITGLAWNTCSPRISPLIQRGLAVNTGTKKKAHTNANCTLWRAVHPDDVEDHKAQMVVKMIEKRKKRDEVLIETQSFLQELKIAVESSEITRTDFFLPDSVSTRSIQDLLNKISESLKK